MPCIELKQVKGNSLDMPDISQSISEYERLARYCYIVGPLFATLSQLTSDQIFMLAI